LTAEASRPNLLPDDFLFKVQQCCDERFGKDLFGENSRQVIGGAVGLIPALQLASEWLASNIKGVVVIAGYDSWLQAPSINHGLSKRRILQVEGDGDGFIPGEAVAAIVVQLRPHSETKSLKIAGIGFTKEVASLDSEMPCVGIGLSEAMKTALSQANLPAHSIHHRLTNISGEEYFFVESSYAWTRVLRENLPPTYEYEQPANVIGEVGAAFGPILLAYALQLIYVSRECGANSLIQLSSAHSSRGVIITTMN